MFTSRRRALVAGAGAVVLAGGVLATSSGLLEHDQESFAEIIKEHHLNTRSAAVAFVKEKLEKGAEAGGEA